MEINFLAILTASVSALVVGFVWYNPKVFGNAWMKAAGMSEEQVKGGNMGKDISIGSIVCDFVGFFFTRHNNSSDGCF